MSEKMQNNAVVVLTSVAARGDLAQPPSGPINGRGKGGKWARWVVHREQKGQIRLARFADQKQFLRIHDNKLDAAGGEGPFTLFRVIDHPGDVVSLESVAFPGQHVGCVPNGDAKAPNMTGAGEHGQFIVKVGGGQGGFGGPFANGSVVRLQSVASGKNLRIHQGRADGQGADGDFAKFIIHKLPGGPGLIRLESFAERKHFLRIQPDGDLDGAGGEGEHTVFRVVKKSPGVVCFESVRSPGWHVGILPNGNAKNGKMTGDGEHGQFRVSRA
jgi:hypothetical protein